MNDAIFCQLNMRRTRTYQRSIAHGARTASCCCHLPISGCVVLVLFLQTDWCPQLRMATTAPLPLPQRRSRRLRGQKPLSPSRRQVEEEWSGASPTPPPPFGGVAPFRGSALPIPTSLFLSDMFMLLEEDTAGTIDSFTKSIYVYTNKPKTNM